MKKLSIGYFGDGAWAHNALKKIIKDELLEIRFVCVRYDTRDKVLTALAEDFGIDVLYECNVNTEDFLEKIAAYGVDMLVSMSFNQIFKRDIINLTQYKMINCHAGKLPLYRGRNILNWALINDEKEFGITVHYVDEGIDTGDIILQRVYEITDEDNYATLLDRAHTACADVLYDAIKLIQNNKCSVIKQSDIDPVGLYCGMREGGDEIIDWNQSSRAIFNFVRAICAPGPRATSFIGEDIIRINSVREVEGAHTYIGIPGQVVGKGIQSFFVKTKDSMVEVIEYEFNKRIKIGMRLKSYVNGR